jgi:hypothetical protein
MPYKPNPFEIFILSTSLITADGSHAGSPAVWRYLLQRFRTLSQLRILELYESLDYGAAQCIIWSSLDPAVDREITGRPCPSGGPVISHEIPISITVVTPGHHVINGIRDETTCRVEDEDFWRLEYWRTDGVNVLCMMTLMLSSISLLQQ